MRISVLLAALLAGLVVVDDASACINDHSEAISAQFDDDEVDEFEAPLQDHFSKLEKAFASQPSRISARENLRFLTQKAHMAGSPQDEVLANWMVAQFTALGIDKAWTDPVKAFLSYPAERPRLALLNVEDETKVDFEASLSEDIVDETSDVWDRNHTFNGYSPSGRVQAKFVYANFGTPEDFKVLRDANVSVANRIVLMRYGKCFRGLKVMNAEKLGALAAIIFSDPHEVSAAINAIRSPPLRL